LEEKKKDSKKKDKSEEEKQNIYEDIDLDEEPPEFDDDIEY
jgi:hypothetical protein